MFLIVQCLCFMVRTRECLINSTLLWHFSNRQKYSCLLLIDSKQIKSEKIWVFRDVRRKNKFVRVQTLSYHLIVTWVLPDHLLGERFTLFGRQFSKLLIQKKDVIYKLNVSMRILKALYFLPSGRFGKIVAGDEMEMFCATSESKELLCLKLLE